MRAEARDPGTHRDQAGGEVGDLRLPGGIADGRRARRGNRRQQEILGGADRRLGQQDVGAAQAIARRRADRAVRELDRGAHGAQARDMEVDAAQADGIAARHRQRRLAATGQQRAEQQHRGAHAGDQLGIDLLRLHAIGRDRHGEARVARRPMHAAAQALQQRRQHGDIEIGRHVAQRHQMRRQQCRHHQRQHRIFGAADRIGADERPAAADDQPVAGVGPPPGSGRREGSVHGHDDSGGCVDSATSRAYTMSMTTNLLQKGWYFTLLK